jgi:hypothetical protein
MERDHYFIPGSILLAKNRVRRIDRTESLARVVAGFIPATASA